MRTSTGLYCRMCYGERVKTAHMSSVRTYNYSDYSSFGWGFLSFLIPILGLILFIVWHKEYPRKAGSCLTGFIVSLVLNFIFWMLMGMFVFLWF